MNICFFFLFSFKQKKLQQGNELLAMGDNTTSNGGANTATTTTTTFTLENGQSFQIPQFQIYTPIYQRPANTNSSGASDELVMIICKHIYILICDVCCDVSMGFFLFSLPILHSITCHLETNQPLPPPPNSDTPKT